MRLKARPAEIDQAAHLQTAAQLAGRLIPLKSDRHWLCAAEVSFDLVLYLQKFKHQMPNESWRGSAML